MEDNVRIGAEHEIAHALAYLAHGRPFVDVEVDGDGCGAVNALRWAGRQDEVACIKMAGPAADFAYLVNRDGEDRALETVVDGWRDLLGLTHPDDDPDAMSSDQAGAAGSGLMAFGFAWAAGFFVTNRALIKEFAGLLLECGGRLSYADVAAVAEDRVRGADQLEMVRVFGLLGPFSETVGAVEAHVQALQAED